MDRRRGLREGGRHTCIRFLSGAALWCGNARNDQALRLSVFLCTSCSDGRCQPTSHLCVPSGRPTIFSHKFTNRKNQDSYVGLGAICDHLILNLGVRRAGDSMLHLTLTFPLTLFPYTCTAVRCAQYEVDCCQPVYCVLGFSDTESSVRTINLTQSHKVTVGLSLWRRLVVFFVGINWNWCNL
jgi:hypothetical protein